MEDPEECDQERQLKTVGRERTRTFMSHLFLSFVCLSLMMDGFREEKGKFKRRRDLLKHRFIHLI